MQFAFFGVDLYLYMLHTFCMDTPNSISDLISKWPSTAQFARDIGCGYQTGRKMFERNSIDPKHWPTVVDAAAKIGVKIDFDWLVKTRASK